MATQIIAPVTRDEPDSAGSSRSALLLRAATVALLAALAVVIALAAMRHGGPAHIGAMTYNG